MQPETQSQKSETALVAFTVLMPASAGICLIGLLDETAAYASLVAAAVGSLGMVASLAHLARLFRAPYSIINWRQSWLSREILAAAAFWLAVFAWCLAVIFSQPGIARALAFVSVILGLVLLYVISRAYRLPTRPAWDGNETVFELAAVMLGPGVALGILSGGFVPDTGLLWLGVPCLAIGAALDYWANRQRIRRLSQMSPLHNTRETIANYAHLAPSIRIAHWLNALSVLVALAAAIIGNPQPGFGLWIVITILELVSHVLSRNVFYALPVQTRYVARLRGPWHQNPAA